MEKQVILSVHAHPDDEASKGAALIARYSDSGAHAVLVTATGGEAGDILNPAMDTPEVRADLPRVRADELAEAVKIIGYDRAEMLGYRDSGMPDSEANGDPGCFARADLDEAAGRLARIVLEERPQVMLTYPEIQRRYPHPDHLRVYEVSMRARELAADSGFAAAVGEEPHLVAKVYFHVWAPERMQALHAKFLELGKESPYSPEWLASAEADYEATTKIDITGYHARRSDALRAHATQIDPESRHWFGLSDSEAEEAYPTEDLFLAAAPEGYRPEGIETDVFAGL